MVQLLFADFKMNDKADFHVTFEWYEHFWTKRVFLKLLYKNYSCCCKCLSGFSREGLKTSVNRVHGRCIIVKVVNVNINVNINVSVDTNVDVFVNINVDVFVKVNVSVNTSVDVFVNINFIYLSMSMSISMS